MEGIKETKEMLEFIAEFVAAVMEAKEDGEITLSDAMSFITLIPAGVSALGGTGLIMKEAADYSKEEIQALSAVFATKFDIPDDKIEQYVEYAITAGLHLAKLLAGLKK
jgi:hypothetical protein